MVSGYDVFGDSPLAAGCRACSWARLSALPAPVGSGYDAFGDSPSLQVAGPATHHSNTQGPESPILSAIPQEPASSDQGARVPWQQFSPITEQCGVCCPDGLGRTAAAGELPTARSLLLRVRPRRAIRASPFGSRRESRATAADPDRLLSRRPVLMRRRPAAWTDRIVRTPFSQSPSPSPSPSPRSQCARAQVFFYHCVIHSLGHGFTSGLDRRGVACAHSRGACEAHAPSGPAWRNPPSARHWASRTP